MSPIFGLIVLFVISVDPARTQHSESNRNFAESEFQYSFKLMKLAFRYMHEENVFYSPYSIFMMQMLPFLGSYESSLRDTLQEHLQMGNTKDIKIISCAYLQEQKRRRRLAELANSLTHTTVERIYVPGNLDVLPCTGFIIGALIRGDSLHDHIEKATGREIMIMLDSMLPKEEDVLTLISASHFKGKFIESYFQRYMMPFWINNSVLHLVKGFRGTGYHNYTYDREIGARFLQLPFRSAVGKASYTSMIILLPDVDLYEAVRQLRSSKLRSAFEQLRTAQVTLTIPDFSFLHQFNISQLPQDCAFSHPTSFPVLKKFFSTRNENSSSKSYLGFTTLNPVAKFNLAATVSATTENNRNGSPPYGSTSYSNNYTIEFDCDRPFMFFIYDSFSKMILFNGIVYNPLELK